MSTDIAANKDPLFNEAVKFVRETQKASISAIQRHLNGKIRGYNHACSMSS